MDDGVRDAEGTLHEEGQSDQSDEKGTQHEAVRPSVFPGAAEPEDDADKRQDDEQQAREIKLDFLRSDGPVRWKMLPAIKEKNNSGNKNRKMERQLKVENNIAAIRRPDCGSDGRNQRRNAHQMKAQLFQRWESHPK